ncbi:unnamed protein product [Acanthoscelides obtectus]|uniref:Uncharacterized protein n=1 Tax=Acanthoscelides obtectus TaxID=200917 RepID=A0A9P0PUS8_ACAOB|nr:unnamed protein product [Acanthoscelides obtectus]CAK1627067.1 hypothetical protein AOBTE_LOCUS4275 [Acanthoscelides obtectus]
MVRDGHQHSPAELNELLQETSSILWQARKSIPSEQCQADDDEVQSPRAQSSSLNQDGNDMLLPPPQKTSINPCKCKKPSKSIWHLHSIAMAQTDIEVLKKRGTLRAKLINFEKYLNNFELDIAANDVSRVRIIELQQRFDKFS